MRIDREKARDNLLGAAATGLFTGFSPFFPGLAASLAGAAIWWLIAPRSHWLQYSIVLLVFVGGWQAARAAQDWWGRYDRRIVIGDLAGMWLALATFPRNPWLWLIGLSLYRLVGAVKFYPALHCREMGPGWGHMAEKAVAGAYAGALLTVASVFFSRFPESGLLLARLAAYATVIAAASAVHLQGTSRGGLGVISAALGGLLFWILAPPSPWLQALVLVAGAIAMAAALRYMAGRPWVLTAVESFLLAWAAWLSLWFLPKLPLVVMAGTALTAAFRHLRPYPTNYLPAWGLTSAMLLPNVVAALYAGAVMQVLVLMFGGGKMTFISYAVTALLRLLRIY